MYECIVLEIMILVYVLLYQSYKSLKLSWRSGRETSGVANTNKSKGSFFIVIGLALVLFLGLRGDFATDYTNYTHIYNRYAHFTFSNLLQFTKRDYIFAIITWVLAQCFNNKLSLFLFMAAITVIGYITIIKRYSPIPWLSLLMWVTIGSFFISANLSRNIMASALFCIAIRYAIEKDIFRYIIIVLIASLIHHSAILMLPAFFFVQVRWSKKYILLLLFLSIPLIVMVSLFSPVIIRFLSNYIYTDITDSSYGMSYGIPLHSIIKVIISILYIFLNIKYIDFSNKVELGFFNITLLYLLFYLCAMNVSMMQRFAFYFETGPIVLIPYILDKKYPLRHGLVLSHPYIWIAVLLIIYSYFSVGRLPYTWF